MNTTINKNFTTGLSRFVLFGTILLAGSVFAATSAIQGIVKDANGRPISGADIRIEAKGGSIWNYVVKTDGGGHYCYSGLEAGGTYRVSLLVNSVVKASINNVTTNIGPTELNFAFTSKSSQASTFGKKSKHLVYLPPQTGTHLGGNWIEIADNGSLPERTERVDTVGKAGVNRMLSNSSVVGINPSSMENGRAVYQGQEYAPPIH